MLTFHFFLNSFFFPSVITLALLTPKKKIKKIIEVIFLQGRDQNSPVINTWSILQYLLPGAAPGGS